jgi:hypothetical protein
MPPRDKPLQACLTDIGRALVLAHRHLVGPLVGGRKYREWAARLGLTLNSRRPDGWLEDDLLAEGALQLVEAAARWEQRSAFNTYATSRVPPEVAAFLRAWQNLQPFAEDDAGAEVLQWQAESRNEHESWRALPCTHETILRTFDGIRKHPGLKAAFRTLGRQSRRMVKAHLTKKQRMTLAKIARVEGMSYREATKTLIESVRHLRHCVEQQAMPKLRKSRKTLGRQPGPQIFLPKVQKCKYSPPNNIEGNASRLSVCPQLSTIETEHHKEP